MSARRPKPRGVPFAPGNRAAAKPESERRVSISLRLPPDAAAKLRTHASKDLSQGDIVAELLRRWEPERKPIR